MAKPLPEDVMVNSGGFWARCAIAVSMNDNDAAMELLRDMHLLEGKIFLSIVPNAREREAKIAAAAFAGRPMESRFASTCAVCCKPIAQGTQILYSSQLRKAAHDACGEVET
ncbi:MAG TPA: hypothetical protein VGM29_11335 [Polyangiaceae bacterium]|jgi:hypothetical protein